MKCPKCQAELPDHAIECVVCCCPIDWEETESGAGDTGHGTGEDPFKPLNATGSFSPGTTNPARP